MIVEAEVPRGTMNLDLILSIVKTSNKIYLSEDTQKIKKIEDFEFDHEYRKYYNIIASSKIFVSSKDALIFIDNYARINNEDYKLKNFLSHKLGIEKYIIGITEDDANYIKEEFKRLKDKIKVIEVENNKADEKISELYKFFGNKLEIKEKKE